MTDLLVTVWAFWDSIRVTLGAAMCLLGGILCIVGTVGVMRFPDFYTRLHAASITDTSGATFILLGMACMAPGWLVISKLFAIFVFIFLTSPTATHAVANAAHVAGLQPLIGKVGEDAEEEERP